jgi:hypothetical protein
MQKDMLQSIDDSALEDVSGGHIGEIIAHVREHVREVADFVGDRAGAALIHAGGVLEAIGSHLKD